MLDPQRAEADGENRLKLNDHGLALPQTPGLITIEKAGLFSGPAFLCLAMLGDLVLVGGRFWPADRGSTRL